MVTTKNLIALGCLVLARTLAPLRVSYAADVEYLNSEKSLPATFPFSEAVRVGETVYLAGQVGNIPGGTDLAEGGMKGEAKQVMDNIQTSLEAHDMSMNNLVKCLVMLTDMSEWGDFNEIYQSYFEEGRYPARSAIGVTELAFGARVEVECIGVVGND